MGAKVWDCMIGKKCAVMATVANASAAIQHCTVVTKTSHVLAAVVSDMKFM